LDHGGQKGKMEMTLQQWGSNYETTTRRNGRNNDKTTRKQKGLGFFHHFIVHFLKQWGTQ